MTKHWTRSAGAQQRLACCVPIHQGPVVVPQDRGWRTCPREISGREVWAAPLQPSRGQRGGTGTKGDRRTERGHGTTSWHCHCARTTNHGRYARATRQSCWLEEEKLLGPVLDGIVNEGHTKISCRLRRSEGVGIGILHRSTDAIHERPGPLQWRDWLLGQGRCCRRCSSLCRCHDGRGGPAWCITFSLLPSPHMPCWCLCMMSQLSLEILHGTILLRRIA